GRRGASAVQLAHELLRIDPSDGLRGLAAATLEEMAGIAGVGMTKAVQVKASLEIGRRLAASKNWHNRIRSASDAAEILYEETRFSPIEQFYAILLNTKNYVLGIELISKGGLDVSLVHPREVFKPAIR